MEKLDQINVAFTDVRAICNFSLRVLVNYWMWLSELRHMPPYTGIIVGSNHRLVNNSLYVSFIFSLSFQRSTYWSYNIFPFVSLCYTLWGEKETVCLHGLSELHESMLDWDMMLQRLAIKRLIFDVIGTSSWASANLSVCHSGDACSLSPCVQGHLLAVLLSDWNCLGSRQRASVVFTQGQDLLVTPPLLWVSAGQI